MIIETKYNLGDTVYYAESVYQAMQTSACERCSGTGKLQIVGGGEIECLDCYGKGGDAYGIYLLEPHKTPSKVGKIEVELYNKQSKYNENKFSYMLYATGVGSGSVWYEEELFLTLEQCTEYCKKENKERIIKFENEHMDK